MLKRFTSTGWIIFWFIFCWPFGIVLLVLRMTGYYNTDSSYQPKIEYKDSGISMPGERYSSRTTIFLVLGILFCIAGVFAATDVGGGSAASGMPSLVAGIILLYFYSKRKKIFNQYDKYLEYLINYPVTTISDLADGVGESEAAVRSAVSDMIQKKLLFAEIVNGDTIVVKGFETPKEAQKAKVRRVVQCPGCGARIEIIEGQSNRCDYCDTALG